MRLSFIRSVYRLAVKGWKEQRLPYAKNAYFDPNTGGYCLMGVAYVAKTGRKDLTGELSEDRKKIRAEFGDYSEKWEHGVKDTGFWGFESLNNHGGNSKTAVLRKFNELTKGR